MTKAFLTTLLLLLGSHLVRASETLMMAHSYGNLHVQWTVEGSLEDQETHHKVYLLARLADSLIRQQGYGAQPVLVQVSPTWDRPPRPDYALSYGSFAYQPLRGPGPRRATGLLLVLQGPDFDLQAALRLLHYGLTHPRYLQAHQVEQVAVRRFAWRDDNGPREEQRPMLPQHLTAQVLRTPNALVARLLRQPLFWQARRRWPEGVLDSLTYYYQDNIVHFFPGPAPRQRRPAPPALPDVLVVDRVQELAGSATDGYFVITSDTTMYYLQPGLRGALGPLRLPRPHSPFRLVLRYTHARHPTERFVLTLSDGFTASQEAVVEPARYRPITRPDQTTAARLRASSPAWGLARLWLLLVAVGGVTLRRQFRHPR